MPRGGTKEYKMQLNHCEENGSTLNHQIMGAPG